MKKYFVLALMLCLPLLAAAAKEDIKQYMTISADATVRAKPNRVSLTLGVFERSEDLAKGREKMKKTIGAALAYCRKAGVAEKYLQTDKISISPRYEERYSKNAGREVEVKYYEFAQTFSVTLDDPAKYDDIFYGLLALGINKVENINFYSTDMRKYRDEARLLAVKAAQEKAKLLTDAAGIKLGKAVNISEDGSHYYGSWYGNAMSNNISQNTLQQDSGDPGDNGDLAPGMVNVKAGISITYELN